MMMERRSFARTLEGCALTGTMQGAPAAEVLVSGSRFELVNARESFEAMWAGEKIPGFLRT